MANVKVLTRGKLFYVVSEDEQKNRRVWYENLGTQVFKVLYYSSARRGFVDLPVNQGLNVNLNQILIIKEKGLLFAESVIRELASADPKESELVKSDDYYVDQFALIQPPQKQAKP